MKRLLAVAVALAFVVVPLGAYVRLSDAGLGCPDWPGCYGHLLGIPDAAGAIPLAATDSAKAWKEMIHRYAAGTLGLLVVAVAANAWRPRRRQRHSPALPTLLFGLVVLQSLLGMWTVTLLLKPLVVTAHLLGGMATLGLLLWLLLREAAPTSSAAPPLSPTGAVALAAIAVQIALGGWVSSHYAGYACPDFPACRADNWLPVDVPTAIHIAHRGGALLVALAVAVFAVDLRRRRMTQPAWLIAAALILQVGLGIACVRMQLALPLAVAHNLGAAFLLAAVLFANAAGRQRGNAAARTTSAAASLNAFRIETLLRRR